MRKKETLKDIVFDLMGKNKCTDQNVVNRYGSLPSLHTVENYKYKYLKEKRNNKWRF